MIEPRGDDLRKIITWRNLGLLEDVDLDKLRERCKSGSIIVGCGDGDQTADFFRFLMQKAGCTHRPHLHMLDGGSIRLIKEAPIPEPYRIHNQFLAELMLSRQLKRIPTLLLCCHYPCGMAAVSHIDLAGVILYNIMAAKLLIKKGWDRKRIIQLFHCDHGLCDSTGGEKKKTYFIKATKQHILAM